MATKPKRTLKAYDYTITQTFNVFIPEDTQYWAEASNISLSDIFDGAVTALQQEGEERGTLYGFKKDQRFESSKIKENEHFWTTDFYACDPGRPDEAIPYEIVVIDMIRSYEEAK